MHSLKLLARLLWTAACIFPTMLHAESKSRAKEKAAGSYSMSDIVRAPSPAVGCRGCGARLRNMHAAIKLWYPTSLGAAYVFESGRDVAACLELENTRPSAHPSTTADLTARCSSSKVAALDRALLKTCSFDSVLQDGVATIVHLRVPSTACDQLPPLRALRAFVRTHYLSSKPVVLIYAYHPACPQEVGAAYFEQMFNFKWQLNTTTTPLGYKLTANAKHRSDSKEGGSAPVLEGGGDLYYDQDRLLCAMANARKFLQSSGGLSYLAASVRKFRSGPTATVGNPFFRHVPPLDWLDAAFDNQKKKAKSAVPSSPPVILANVSSSALTSAGGLRKGSSSSDRRRRRHDGSGTASETEQQQGEVQARLRDALWLAPREQASADADASFTRPRVWKRWLASSRQQALEEAAKQEKLRAGFAR